MSSHPRSSSATSLWPRHRRSQSLASVSSSPPSLLPRARSRIPRPPIPRHRAIPRLVPRFLVRGPIARLARPFPIGRSKEARHRAHDECCFSTMSLGSSPGSRDALDVVRDVIIDRGHRRTFVLIAPRPDLSRAASLVVASRDRLGSLENAQTTVFVPKIEIMRREGSDGDGRGNRKFISKCMYVQPTRALEDAMRLIYLRPLRRAGFYQP